MHAVETEGRPGRQPGNRVNSEGLTGRQAAILDFIEREVDRQGYPPSMREIGKAVNLSSTSSVSHQLMALEGKGKLFRIPTGRAPTVSVPGGLTNSPGSR